MGTAVIAATTELLVLSFNSTLVYRALRFAPRFGLLLKALVSALAMGTAVFFLDKELLGLGLVRLLILIPIGGVVYVGLLFAFKTFTPEMLSFVKRGSENV